MDNNLTFINLFEKSWHLLLQAPKGSIDMRYKLDLNDFALDISLSHHLEILIYRWGHQVLRNAEKGAFSIAVYSREKRMIKNIEIKDIDKKNEKYIIIKYVYCIEKIKGTQNPSTEFPERLMALHLNALNGLIYQSEGKIILIIPGDKVSKK